MEELEVLGVVILETGDCFEFFALGITYGLIMSGVCFFVGLAVSQCLKLINMAR